MAPTEPRSSGEPVPAEGGLAVRLRAGEAVVAGVLSGTSGDGIDVALMRFAPAGTRAPLRPELLDFATLPFPGDLGSRVRAALDGEPLDLRGWTLLDRDLGAAFGAAARERARAAGVPLALVGSHGQTVWHHDGVDPAGRASRQLGEGDFVAEHAGAPAVTDFRQGDLAAGGEGAPLVPLVDDWLFAGAPRPLALLNLGGIANLTWLGPEGERVGFDTGPAGCLLDGLARRLLDRPLDADGAAAGRGTPLPGVVEDLLAHPFFAAPPPKSTGRDTFGGAWLEAALGRAAAGGVDLGSARAADDLLATGVEVVARGVALGLAGLPRVGTLHVAGGGWHHRPLRRALARAAGVEVRSSAELGVPPDAREALAFGCLAAARVLGLGVTAPGATGARPGRALGKISAGPARSPDGPGG